MSDITKVFSKIYNLKIMWQRHALQRMFERSISRDDVKVAIAKGKIIEEYLNDFPYPSYLIAYINIRKPLHVVLSYDEQLDVVYIITAYIPNRTHFKENLITRNNNE